MTIEHHPGAGPEENVASEEAFTQGREFLDNLQSGLDLLAERGAGFPSLDHGRITFTAASAFGDKNAQLFVRAQHCSRRRYAFTRFGDEHHSTQGYPAFIYLDPVEIDYFTVNVPSSPRDSSINVFAYGMPVESSGRDYIIEREVYRMVGLRNFDLAVVIPRDITQG
jgi:hypothetical protein